MPSRNDKIVLRIAIGGTDLGKVKNVEYSWRKLRGLFDQASVDASITFAQYLALDVGKQLERKKAPGFIVGCHFESGVRNRQSMGKRWLLSLDMDSLTPELFAHVMDRLSAICEYEFLAHTTRKHCPEKPRLRIHIPLASPVDLDEFDAVVRIIATKIFEDPQESIDECDVVSFRGPQVAFRPSISKGQEYKVMHNEGVLLDPQAVLAEFSASGRDWRDPKNLPRRSDEKEVRSSAGAKMEDPREKMGLIGAFCRAYGVEAAIAEFIPDVYVPSGKGEYRWTYTGGQSADGMVVYDDLFMTTHHGTDPVAGSANAWDMVRIHKFGHLDKKVPEDASPSELPSFKAMVKLAEGDAEVRKERMAATFDTFEFEDDDEDLLGDEPEVADEFDDILGAAEPKPEVADEFDDILGAAEPKPKPKAEKPAKEKPAEKPEKDDKAWLADLRVKANGRLEPVLHNAALILRHDPRIAPCIAYNQFTLEPVAMKQIRSKKVELCSPPVDGRDKKHGRRWTDEDDISIKRYCGGPETMGLYEVDFASLTIQEAVLLAGHQRAFHPVKDLMWAGHAAYVASGRATKGSIERLSIDYVGTPDTIFHRESSKLILIAMVARVFEPGCKFDCVTILKGKQGGRKSDFWIKLAGGFFSELPKMFDRADRMIEAMRGSLICEMAEMAGLKKETFIEAKEFITRGTDKHRLAYAKREGTYPRQSILTGTSNEGEILHDPTGNRRFWVWDSTATEDVPMDLDTLEKNLPMLWGEAMDEYLEMRKAQPTGGLHLDLRSKESRRIRDEIGDSVRARTATEEMADMIAEWLDEPQRADRVILDRDGFAKHDDGADRMVIRNRVTPALCMKGLQDNPAMRGFRNADVRTFGRALALVPGWVVGIMTRAHGGRAIWYYREGPHTGKGAGKFIPDTSIPEWIDSPEDDLLG